MTPRRLLEQALAWLSAQDGAVLRRCALGAPASADDIAVVQHLGGPLPPALLALYRQMDGVGLAWTWQANDHAELGGSLDILPLRQAWLGISPLPDGEPGEGQLWNREFSSAALRRLKPMRVLESTAGAPVFITVLPGSDPLQLYRVEEETAQRLWPAADVCLALLLQYLGCEGLREALTRRNWQRQLDTDPRLLRLAKVR